MAKIKRAEEQLKEKTDTFSLSLIFQTACNNTAVLSPINHLKERHMRNGDRETQEVSV